LSLLLLLALDCVFQTPILLVLPSTGVLHEPCGTISWNFFIRKTEWSTGITDPGKSNIWS
jgi:hypothetical protein